MASEPFSWNKPVRFAKVQNDDHVNYRPQVLGTFRDNNGALIRVVLIANWRSNLGLGEYRVGYYDLDGDPVVAPDTRSTGIMDPKIVNGAEIKTISEVTGNGTVVQVTYEGDKRVRATL